MDSRGESPVERMIPYLVLYGITKSGLVYYIDYEPQLVSWNFITTTRNYNITFLRQFHKRLIKTILMYFFPVWPLYTRCLPPPIGFLHQSLQPLVQSILWLYRPSLIRKYTMWCVCRCSVSHRNPLLFFYRLYIATFIKPITATLYAGSVLIGIGAAGKIFVFKYC